MMMLGKNKLWKLRIYFKCFPVILFILELQIIGSLFAKYMILIYKITVYLLVCSDLMIEI